MTPSSLFVFLIFSAIAVVYMLILCEKVQNEDLPQPISQIRKRNAVKTKNTISKKLEFIHITKTGGSAIERAASMNDITWGACHYINVASNGVGCHRPDLLDRRKGINETNVPFEHTGSFGEPWHTPPHWMLHYPFRDDKTFTVVRNPYSRAVSLFYCKYKGFKGTLGQMNNATVMNTWLQETLNDPTMMSMAHFLPQHHYVYDRNGMKLVDHVLKHENLNHEFSMLMTEYNLNVTLPQDTKLNARDSDSSLTTQDLDAVTIELIKDLYYDDFKRFGYNLIQDQ